MQRERSVAIEALRKAAQVCRAVQAAMVDATTLEKRDRSPVTVADFASQAVVSSALVAAFPPDPIVAEEGSEALRLPSNRATLEHLVRHVRAVDPDADQEQILAWIDRGGGEPADRFWTLDPIDGTKGFLRRGHYAVALALIESGRVVLGALACPELPVDPRRPDGDRGVLCLAVRGQGAWAMPLWEPNRAPVPLCADRAADPGAARIVESVESGHADQDAHRRVADRLGVESPPLRMDSQAKYAAVARGDASIYLRLPSPATPDYRERIWDHAAGACIVEAAGGTVTDAGGKPLDWSAGKRLVRNQGVIVTGGCLHAAVVRAAAGEVAVS